LAGKLVDDMQRIGLLTTGGWGSVGYVWSLDDQGTVKEHWMLEDGVRLNSDAQNVRHRYTSPVSPLPTDAADFISKVKTLLPGRSWTYFEHVETVSETHTCP